MLTSQQIQAFVADGFVRIDEAFPADIADAARDILWRATGCDPDDHATWTRPVVVLGDHAEPPFAEAANTTRLRQAFDQLVGSGRWVPRRSLGSFPIRFPSAEDSNDSGWHVDASFPGANPADYMSYRVNLSSKGRALLMLFLFSDVGLDDAPTRIRIGSHREVARILEPHGDEGLPFMELAKELTVTDGMPEALATGPAGAVYLCHPFLIHAAQQLTLRADQPRFMAQPPLHPVAPLCLDRSDGAYSPVEQAIREGLARA